MSFKKQIGKIQSINFGKGGYQDVMVGISITLGSDTEHWGVSDFKGAWGHKRRGEMHWTEEDRIKRLGEMVMWFNDLLEKAKAENINELIGKPVEVTFEDNQLSEWRILSEVL